MPTHRLSVKKEGVWCDLSKKGANSWIFGEKGNNVAQPPCHFSQLGEKGRCVAQPQQGANLQIFGKNGNGVAQPQKFGKKSLFLCLPVQIKRVENPFNGLTTIPALGIVVRTTKRIFNIKEGKDLMDHGLTPLWL